MNIRHGLSLIQSLTKDTVRQQTKPILFEFLEETAKCYTLKIKFLACYKQFAKIKTQWINQWEVKRQRRNWVIERWKKEIGIITNICFERKDKNKKLRIMWKKLPLINEDIKLKIIDYYMELATSKYNIRYYLWRKQVLKKKRK